MKYSSYVLFVIQILISFSCYLYAQEKNLTENVQYLSFSELENNFYSSYDKNDFKKSQKIASYYLSKAKKEHDEKHIVEGYVLNQYNQKLPIALKYIDSIEAISKNIVDDRYPSRIYLLKGLQYYNADYLDKALENYITALNFAKEKKNNRQVAIADLQIAYLNGYIGKTENAVKVLEHYNTNTDYLKEEDIQHVRVNLAGIYLDNNQYEKAIPLISEGIKINENVDKSRYYRFLMLLGRYNIKVKKFDEAIKNLEKCKAFFKENKYVSEYNYSLYYLGKSYTFLGNKEKAESNFIEIDSSVEKTENTFPELREVYSFLIDFSKIKNDKEKQLYYIERFLKVDSILDSHFKYISHEIPDKYNTPQLLLEKEKIIKNLENTGNISYIAIGFLFFSSIILTILFLKAKKRERVQRNRAQELIKSVQQNLDLIIPQKQNIIKEEIETAFEGDKNKLSDEIVSSILKGLQNFEEKEQFLKKGITLNALAKKMKTNSTYLSQVVNSYKEKNFAIYLNDLRIEYALNRLVKDKKFRSYKLSVIAEELGYNNEQAFALAFKKRTGTTLTVYIKEISNQDQI